MNRDPESGVALVNVLVVLTLTASIVTNMITLQSDTARTAQRSAAISDALALAYGGEASARVALSADADRAVDHLAESWAEAVQQKAVTLQDGSVFGVQLADVQGQFDVNRLSRPTALDLQIFARIAGTVGVTSDDVTRVIAVARRIGPVLELNDLVEAGAAASAIEALRPHVAAWPRKGLVNLNSADAVVLGALLANPRAAAGLLRARDRSGGLSSADVVPPPGAGFNSDILDVTTTVEVDGETLVLRSRLVRDGGAVRVVRRRVGPAS